MILRVSPVSWKVPLGPVIWTEPPPNEQKTKLLPTPKEENQKNSLGLDKINTVQKETKTEGEAVQVGFISGPKVETLPLYKKYIHAEVGMSDERDTVSNSDGDKLL